MKGKLETEVVVADKYQKKDIVVHRREILDETARTAISFIERWGMVAAVPDGEDTAGRQKLRLSTPKELVDRAFEIACQCVEQARSNGHVIECPAFELCNSEEK
jgi:hypothetical protein